MLNTHKTNDEQLQLGQIIKNLFRGLDLSRKQHTFLDSWLLKEAQYASLTVSKVNFPTLNSFDAE